MIVIERGDLVMVFNFHPTQSYTDYKVGCLNNGERAPTFLFLASRMLELRVYRGCCCDMHLPLCILPYFILINIVIWIYRFFFHFTCAPRHNQSAVQAAAVVCANMCVHSSKVQSGAVGLAWWTQHGCLAVVWVALSFDDSTPSWDCALLVTRRLRDCFHVCWGPFLQAFCVWCCVAAVCVPPGPYRLVLSSDEEVFGGWKNLSKETDGEHQTQGVSHVLLLCDTVESV